MPVAVRNREKGPSVFSDPATNVAIEWAGADDPDGGDIQYVPDVLLDDINFMRALNKEIFEVLDPSDEVRAKLARQGVSYRERRDADEALTQSVLEHSTEKPIMVATVDEKGQSSNVASTPREAGEIRVNVTEDPNIYGPEDQGVATPAGPVVQMDEQGRPMERQPDLKVEMGPRESE